MKKLILILTLFPFLFNCSDKGELEIQNHTNALINITIDGTSYQIPANNDLNKSWELSNFILNPEEKTVTISGEGLFKFIFNEQKKIKPKETTSFYISADAGAIKLQNSSSVYVKSVFISPSSDRNWGDDDLEGTMAPGDVLYWRVVPGYWDIRVIDQNNKIYESFENKIIANYSSSFYISGQTTKWMISKNLFPKTGIKTKE